MYSTWLPGFVCGLIIVSGTSAQDYSGLKMLRQTFFECIKANESYSCISDKVGRAVERSMDWDVPIVDGITLVRNKEIINHRQARILGSDRLKQALVNFLDTHVISLELGGARELGRAGQGYRRKKGIRKEKKYMQYAFMVLLGIFGLTGPLVMKILGIMAAKALVAAKAALIIVGSVALKKLFEKDRQEPIINVHAIDNDEEEEYDRLSKYGYVGYGNSNTGDPYINPYSSYYGNYYGNTASKSISKAV